ncbi:MAG: ATP-binding protein [Novosphingobium sp.]
MNRILPTSLKGQILLAMAVALMLAQGVSAVLLYRAQHDRRESGVVHTAAMRLFSAIRQLPTGSSTGPRPALPPEGPPPGGLPPGQPPADVPGGQRDPRFERSPVSPLQIGETRDDDAEGSLREILDDQGVRVSEVVVIRRLVAQDSPTLMRLSALARMMNQPMQPPPRHVLVAGIRRPGMADWLIVRAIVSPYERQMLVTILLQTIFIYAVLFGAVALLLRRITRPLAAVTSRFEHFAATQDPGNQLEPQGPDDIRRVIVAQNAMEGRITSLLNEKDVMLGAIGHDLKTPLAALRVRIESVEDEGERAKMAATIEDITRSLDDILSLARVGRPSDPREPTELSAMVASVVEEYEDMGEPVTLAETRRLVLSLRPTWLRRALRNLIGNALRYGHRARVSLERVGDSALIRIEDDGPGIAESQIDRMQEPFTRGDPSRNSETGGAGLGLTLARAIAEQHGGTLSLVNRRGADGAVCGLLVTLAFPIR